MSKILVDSLYPTVEGRLKEAKNTKLLKNSLDDYMVRNAHKYTTQGPIYRPIFSQTDRDKVYDIIGLLPKDIMITIKQSKAIGSEWKIMNDPFNTALCLMTRFYSIQKNKDMIVMTLQYCIISMYPSLHYKYFKYEPNEAIMNYTINDLSNKFKIKQKGILWEALVDIVIKAHELHNDKLIKGEDEAFIAFIQDVKTRLNSFLKKISNEFYDNEKQGKYLNSEHESFDEENYFESDNNSYAIERVSNKVVTHLVVNGPDMKLVEISAKMNKVSINELRNYTQTMINGKQREDIKDVVEAILFLFLFSEQGAYTAKDIHSNKFMHYSMEIYKKSNTSDKNIIKIKSILDRWLKELGLFEKTSRDATINDFRKSLYTFFVLSIQKIA